jgi:hypothetical protein
MKTLTLNPKNYKVGDTIKFSTITRSGKETVKRKIVSIDSFGLGVRYNGWNPYYLNNPMLDKIIEHIKL